MHARLHYINSKRLYGADLFAKEAQELGVNRCLPLGIIKHLKWGEKILLATFEPKTPVCICMAGVEEQPKTNCPVHYPRDGRGNKRGGTAYIFGYFTVTGLSYTGASAEFREALTSLLSVETLSRPNQAVHRQCGSYTISISCTVNNSIEDIICKAQNLSEERNEKVKFFVAGLFTPMKLVISPVSFSRALITVETDWHDTPPQDITEDVLKLVNTLTDYNKRTYIKTQEKRGRPRKNV